MQMQSLFYVGLLFLLPQPAIDFSFVGLIIAKIASSQVAHINCGNCRTTLMYPYGAPSVKCAVCQYVTNASVSIDEPSDF